MSVLDDSMCGDPRLTGTSAGPSAVSSHPVHRATRSWLPAAVFLLGLTLQVWLWSRAWLYWDQIALLKLGMKLALDGEIASFAKVMSGGGAIPGSLLQFLVGGPLALWFDFRSPGLVVLLFHLGAGLVLWRLIGRALGSRFALIYLAVYWLSPWRLYHSGFIWEPNYLLLPAALHLWATWRQRHEASLPASVLLGLVLVSAPQIHASGLLLILLTAFLLLRRVAQVHWPGIAVGGMVATVPLLPAATAFLRGHLPAVAPAGHVGEGFLRVYPVFKAVGYWLRLGTLEMGRRLEQVAFYPGNYEGAQRPLADAALYGLRGLGLATVVVGLAASVWYFSRRVGNQRDEAEFFRRYAISAFGVLVIAAGLLPLVIQSWYALVLLHAICLPVAAWINDSSRQSGRIRLWSISIFLFLRLPIIAVVGLGHPMYRIPDDPKELARVAPGNLPSIEFQQIPFGASKDEPLPSQRSGSDGQEESPRDNSE